MFIRKIDFNSLLIKKSFFLFGARSTGKSFWIKKNLHENTFYINLLDSEISMRLMESPALLKKMIATEKKKLVIIDEIQKIPQLLDEVHNLIEDEKINFLLTGSSARKLKRSHANMLGGRAGIINLYPLSFSEIENFDLEKYLTIGGLPRIYESADPELELDSYLNIYIEQEIKLEANIRNLPPFHRFLKSAALSNGELINYSNIASDSGVPASTVKEYYSVLEDGLIGHILEPWVESKKRKAIQTAKFYFFDPGVCNFITGTKTIERHSDLFGRCFEQFIFMELKSYNSYLMKRKKIYFWRSVNKQEVDFVIDDIAAIEVKASKKIANKHFSGLKAIKEEKIIKNYYIVSDDPINRQEEGFIQVLYWKDFLNKLWNGEIF